MAIYLKKFETQAEYEQYINGSGAILPNVSICTTEGGVYYNPYVELETRVVVKYNVPNAGVSTKLANSINGFSAMEIDGVMQQSVATGYTFSTTGEHTVKYTLLDQTTLKAGSFYGCSFITNVVIPDVVVIIEQYTFNGCNGLTSVTIGNSVTNIANNVFQNCTNLINVKLSNSLTSIGDYAFNACTGLLNISIPDSVLTINGDAFSSCSGLTNCIIGSGVTSIGNYAFNYCTNLTSITCNAAIAPTIQNSTFQSVHTNGTLTVPIGSSGYDVWMGTGNYYLGKYNWTKVEQ